MGLGYQKDPFFMGDMGVIGAIGPTGKGPGPGETIIATIPTRQGAINQASTLVKTFKSTRVFINLKGENFLIMTTSDASRYRESKKPLVVESKPIDILNYKKVSSDTSLSALMITANKLRAEGKTIKVYKEGAWYHLVQYDPAGAATQRKFLEEQELTKKFGPVILVASTDTKASADRWVSNYQARGVTTAFTTYDPSTNKYHLKYRSGQRALYETVKAQFVEETAKRQAEELATRQAEALVYVIEYPTAAIAREKADLLRSRGVESAIYKLFGGKHNIAVMQKDLEKYRAVRDELMAEQAERFEEQKAKLLAEAPVKVDGVPTIAEAIRWKDHYRANGVTSAYYVHNPEATASQRYGLYVWQKELEQYHRVKAGILPDPFTAFWNWLTSLFKVDLELSGGNAIGAVYINDAHGYNMVRQINNQFTKMGFYSEITRMEGGYIVAFTV